MEQYNAKSISDGIAIGKILFYSKQQQIQKRKVTDTDFEIARYERAKAAVAERLRSIHQNKVTEIFECHAMLIEDEIYSQSVIDNIREKGINAEAAVEEAGEKFAGMFCAMEDIYLRERSEDIEDITRRLIDELMGISSGIFAGEEPVILVTDNLAPSELIQLDKGKILAFVTGGTSMYSHTAILARNMNIPAVTDVKIQESWNGKTAIVDGRNGQLFIEPEEQLKLSYQAECEKIENSRSQLNVFRELKDITKGGKEICLYANIERASDAEFALAQGAAGIGLFRSEFLYLEKGNYPTEEEQFQVYKKIIQTMNEKKTVIRTMDIRGDKQFGTFVMGKEEFYTQIRAVYRASAFGTAALMFPMISSVKELLEIKDICNEVKDDLKKAHICYKDIELGIMIETPAAVSECAMLAKEVDFLSIGTNDLLRCTPAMDAEALLCMVQTVVENGHREGCRTGICGELGADPEFTETFVKMGIDEFSVTPDKVLLIRKKIREMEES